jgi:hypothetical protein
MHAVTWVVTAALIPLLCWDVWQSQQEAHLRREELTLCAADPGSLKDSPDCVNVREAERSVGVGNLSDLPPLRLPDNKK